MKKKLAKFSFLFFFHRSSVPPHWEHCHSEKLSRKKLSLKNFLSEKYNFYHLPCVAPLINFAKSFNILFSWKYFSMTKKITWKDFFNFHHQSYLPYLPPLIKISFKNVVWLEKDLFLRDTVFLNCIFCFENHFCVPHWWIIPKQSTLFWWEQESMIKNFSKRWFFFSITGPL